jgi:glutamate 5-kinase
MSQEKISSVLRDARRIVVKVGSSLVTNEGRGLDETAIGEWSRQLAALVRGDGVQRREVIMVSSGAIAEGMKRLGWSRRPREVHELQAAAAVGQMGLAQMYETKLRENGVGSAQVLLTHADLADRERYLNARSTLLTLLTLGVVPVINENDTVVNDEIKFGDNDTLGALVANLVEADALVILTDQKGLYTADPRRDPTAQFVHEARAGDLALEDMAGGAGLQHRQGRHDHQDPGGQACSGLWRLHGHCLGAGARCAAASGQWRTHWYLAGGADGQDAGAQAMDGRSPAVARSGDRGRRGCSQADP